MFWRTIALAVVGVALITSVAAAAKSNVPNKSARLQAVGDEPAAAGRATMSGTVDYDEYGNIWGYITGLKVTCTGLTPGQTYVVGSTYWTFGSGPFVADSEGSFTAYSEAVGFMYYYWHGLPKDLGVVEVDRQTATGLVPVLYGTFH
jgi:hypothetical protein